MEKTNMETPNSIYLKIEGLPPRKTNFGYSLFNEKSAQTKYVNNLRKEFDIHKSNILVPYFSNDIFGIEVIINIYFKTNQIKLNGDLDNYISGIFDCLQKYNNINSTVINKDFGLILDDIYIDRVSAYKSYNSEKDYFTIQITRFEK